MFYSVRGKLTDLCRHGCWLLATVLCLVGTGRAANFRVNSTAHAADANPGDGVCQTVDGVCTLLAALQEANSDPAHDWISLPTGVYLNPTSQEYVISGDLTVQGGGIGTTVDAGGNSRGFRIIGATEAKFRDFTIQNGFSSGDGGGIYFDNDSQFKALDLEDMIIRSNRARRGGGLYLREGSCDMRQCLVENNSTSDGDGTGGGDGAGMYVEESDVGLIRSVFQNNTCGRHGHGGAICHFDGGTPYWLRSSWCTFRNNRAGGGSNVRSAGDGGAIRTGGSGAVGFYRSTFVGNQAGDNPAGTAGDGGALSAKYVSLENCTVSGNRAGAGLQPGNGGGIAGGPVWIRHSTITDNRVSSSPGRTGRGGGIYHEQRGIYFHHSIIDGNFGGSGAAEDFVVNGTANAESQGYNILGTVVGSLTVTTIGNKPGPALLLPLEEDPQSLAQGPSWDVITRSLVHRPTAASPAVNGGDPAYEHDGRELDQRGSPRVMGRIDIGAVELQPVDLSVTSSPPACVEPGAPFDLELAVANVGTVSADCVTVTIPLVYPFSLVSSSSCTETGAILYCEGLTIEPGAVVDLDVVLALDPGAPIGVPFTNVATVAFETCDPTAVEFNFGDNISTSVIQASRVVDLALDITNSQPAYEAGSIIDWTLVVTNRDTQALAGATFMMFPPAGVTNLTWTCAGQGCPTASGNGLVNGGIDLAGGQAITYQISGLVTAPAGSLVHAASLLLPQDVITPDGAKERSAEHRDDVIPVVDLSIATVVQGLVRVGTPVRVLMTISNAGPSTATAVVVTGAFDSVYFDSAVSTFPLPELAAGASMTLLHQATLKDLGAGAPYFNLSHTATVSNVQRERDGADNTASLTFDAEAPDLAITLHSPSNSGILNITVINRSAFPVTGAVVSNRLSFPLPLLGSSCGAIVQGDHIVWTLPPLGPGARAGCGLTFQPPDCCTELLVTNNARIGSPGPASLNEDNVAQIVFAFAPRPPRLFCSTQVVQVASEGVVVLTEADVGVGIVGGCGVLTTNPVTVTSGVADAGTQHVEFVVEDECGNASTCSVPVLVAWTNTPPTLPSAPPIIVAVVGTTVSVAMAASDPDLPAQPLSYSLPNNSPAGASISSAGLLTWVPADSDVGTRPIIVIVSDGSGGLDSAPVLIRVIPQPIIVAIEPGAASGTMSIHWPSLPGTDYRLEWSPEIDVPTWSEAGSTTATGAVSSLGHAMPVERGFFRVTVLP